MSLKNALNRQKVLSTTTPGPVKDVSGEQEEAQADAFRGMLSLVIRLLGQMRFPSSEKTGLFLSEFRGSVNLSSLWIVVLLACLLVSEGAHTMFLQHDVAG